MGSADNPSKQSSRVQVCHDPMTTSPSGLQKAASARGVRPISDVGLAACLHRQTASPVSRLETALAVMPQSTVGWRPASIWRYSEKEACICVLMRSREFQSCCDEGRERASWRAPREF